MTDETTIYPTHSCFDDSVANLAHLMHQDGARMTNGTLLICHGIISPDGRDIAHAWLELDGKEIVDSGILNGEKITYHANLASFYRESKARDVTKYKPVDAAGLELKLGFGPWEQKYKRLCGREAAV
jgi:hypothetical protein